MAPKKKKAPARRSARRAPNALLSKLRKVTRDLAEAREVIRAIKFGEIDAVVVNADKGVSIFTLENADQPYRIMIETMNEGAVTVRKDGIIFFCNQRFADLLGAPAESLVGGSIYSYIEDPAFKTALENAGAGSGKAVFTLKTSSGGEVLAQIARSPANVQDEPGACLIVTDLTDRKKAEDELKRSRDLLEARVEGRTADLARALVARDDFLSIASHELKTPLTSLKMQVQLRGRKLDKGDFAAFEEASIRKMLSDDECQIDRLTRLVEDMLDLSRLTTGQFSIVLEKTDLCQVVSEVIAGFAPQLQVSGVQILFKPTLPSIIGTWDRFRLAQIATNILSNALKYGQKKPVLVNIVADGLHARLIITDQGVGIESLDRARIFERFARGASASGQNGLGVGLYIVKQLVEAHHGTVWVDSVAGKGSTFTVRIPLDSSGSGSRAVSF